MKYIICVLCLSVTTLYFDLLIVGSNLNVGPNVDFKRLLRIQHDLTAAKIMDAVDECNQTLPVPLEEGMKMFAAKDPKFLATEGELPSTKDGKCLIDCTMRKMNMMTDKGFQSSAYVKAVKQILYNYSSYDFAPEASSIRKKYYDAVTSFQIEYKIINRYEIISQICQMGVEDPKKDKCEFSYLIARCLINFARPLFYYVPLFPFARQ